MDHFILHLLNSCPHFFTKPLNFLVHQLSTMSSTLLFSTYISWKYASIFSMHSHHMFPFLSLIPLICSISLPSYPASKSLKTVPFATLLITRHLTPVQPVLFLIFLSVPLLNWFTGGNNPPKHIPSWDWTHLQAASHFFHLFFLLSFL